MDRQIISPRAFTLFGLLLILVILLVANGVKAATPGEAVIPAEQSLPTEDALSTVAVVDHAGNLYSMWVTMKDGRVLCFDKRSAVPMQIQVAWAQLHGGHTVAVIAPYEIVGGDKSAT